MTRRSATLAFLIGSVLIGSAALAVLTVTDPQSSRATGLPDPGAVTRWGLPVAQGMRDLSAALTIGLVFAVAVLLPQDSRTRSRLAGARAQGIGAAGLCAGLWAFASAVVVVFSCSDVAGVPVVSPALWSELPAFVKDTDVGQANMISTVLVGVVAVGCLAARRFEGAEVAILLLSLAALWPLSSTGHVSTDDNHQQAVLLLFVHLVAVTIWIGGLAALAFLQGEVGRYRDAVLRRYSVTAACCLTAVAVSGVVGAWLRLGTWSELGSPYGVVILIKVGVLLALGAIGYLHRRRLVDKSPTWTEHARRRFAALAGGELLIMCLAMALGVALGRTPPPPSLDRNASSATPDASDRHCAALDYEVHPSA